MRGFVGGTNTFVDSHITTRTSLNILYILGKRSEDVEHPS